MRHAIFLGGKELKYIPWLGEAVPGSSRELYVRGKDIVVPRKEAQHLKREHDIDIEAPITLEEVGELAAEKPHSEYREALGRWLKRLYRNPKEEFIEKTIEHGWKIKGYKKRLEGEERAAAIGWTVARKCMNLSGEMDKFL